MVKRSDCGSGGCITCPFSYNEEAEQVQNYGCLPTRQDIVKMKEETDQNWECHSSEGTMCGGFARYISESRPDLSTKKGNLISYNLWETEGKEVAIFVAKRGLNIT